MQKFGHLLVVTLVRGILFLVPVMLVAVLAREGYQILRKIAQPLARLLPADRFLGILAEDLISIVAILIVFLIAGLFVGTNLGNRLSDRLEHSVLYRVPGYLMVRGTMGHFPGLKSEAPPEPALVAADDGWAFALLVERAPPGFCTIFLPDSPTPTTGSVRIVEESRVRLLDVSMLSLLACLTRSGTGAGALTASLLTSCSTHPREPSIQDSQPNKN